MKDLKTLAISEEEAKNDYKRIEDGEVTKRADKQNLAEKYGVQSIVVNNIKTAILEVIAAHRLNKTSFDIDDLRYFEKLRGDLPGTYKTALTRFENESYAFVEYLYEYTCGICVKNKLIKKQDNGDYVQIKFGPYGISYSDTTWINTWKTIKRWLEENTDEGRSKTAATKNNVEMIHNTLKSQMSEFRVMYLDAVETNAKAEYNSMKKNINKYKEEYEKVKEEEKSIGRGSYNEYIRWEKKFNKVANKYNNARITLMKPMSEYCEKLRKEAERAYEISLNELSARIEQHGINASKLRVSEIKDDPKYFSMHITDGVKNLYARSIIAAVFSDKVRAHFRFIITTTKDF